MSYHNIEAEQQLLGCILIRNDTFDLVADMLKPEHFFDPVHRRIYEVAAARIGKNHVASPVTLRSVLEDEDGLKALGGPKYLAQIAGAAIMPSHIRDYAGIVIGDAARRALEEGATSALQNLRAGGEAPEVRAALLSALQSLPEAKGEESTHSLLKAVSEAVSAASEAYQGGMSFLKTGVPALDRIIKGLGPGDLCILGGATSMGKTSMSLEIAGNVAAAGQGVAFVSLEMTRQELATRMTAARARVSYTDLRDPSAMSEDAFRKWIEASSAMAELPIEIIPKHIRDIPAIHAAARRAASVLAKPLSLLVVDYAQLVRGAGKSRYEQMTEVSIGLKQIAGMLGVPVVALCQLSRDIGSRDDKRPQLNDIKETGQFENDADQVIFCHRESYWMERSGPKPNAKGEITDQANLDWQADLAANRNVMELLVRKNRHGPISSVKVGFHAPENRFWDLNERQTQAEGFL